MQRRKKRRDSNPELKRVRQRHTRALNRLSAAYQASAALQYEDAAAEAEVAKASELYRKAKEALIDEELKDFYVKTNRAILPELWRKTTPRARRHVNRRNDER